MESCKTITVPFVLKLQRTRFEAQKKSWYVYVSFVPPAVQQAVRIEQKGACSLRQQAAEELRSGIRPAIDRFQRDKDDPSVIVFGEIQRCQNPDFTQFFSKAKKPVEAARLASRRRSGTSWMPARSELRMRNPGIVNAKRKALLTPFY